ncbi:MAG: cytochrome P460 family protein [Candidatus Rokuibacteriota bacterium]
MRPIAIALALASIAIASPGSAGPEKVGLPAPAKRQVFLGTVDRPDVKQVREVFASLDTVNAARPGQMLPGGSVLTMDIYAAKLDEKGEPLKDAAGRLTKGSLTAVFVMEKRAGWGAEYPVELRNGEWEYARFDAAGKPGPADTRACLQCHKPKADQDYVFSMPKLLTR